MKCMIERVTSAQINAILGNRLRFQPGQGSVFERLALKEDDNSAIVIRTHQLRHYLSDLAMRVGVSDFDLAAWAGRRPEQNICYSSVSDTELLAQVQGALQGLVRWHGPLGELAVRSPVDRDSFITKYVPTAHTTELGVCIHDFAQLPCQLHVDCMFCTEHVCIKGDGKRTEAVQRILQEQKSLLARAKGALSRRDYGADRWVQHADQVVKRLTELARLLTDRALPDGSVIQLAGVRRPSRFAHLFNQQLELPAVQKAKGASMERS
jgi:hypothetical protein